MQFMPECCLAIDYIQYKMVSIPQENVHSVQFVDVASEASLRTRKFSMQLITSHDKNDCDGKTNGLCIVVDLAGGSQTF